MFKPTFPIILILAALMTFGCSDDNVDETEDGLEEEVINYPESPA